LEKAIVARIMADLKKRPNVIVRKRHGTAMGVAGDPDLTAPSKVATLRSRLSVRTTPPRS
jgi:hypothetical protein